MRRKALGSALCAFVAVIFSGASAHADAVGPSSQPKVAVYDASCATTGCTIVTGVSGKIIRVWSYLVQNKGAVAGTLRFASGSSGSCGIGLSPYMVLNANAFNMRSASNQAPLFESASGGHICAVASGSAVTLAASVEYTEGDALSSSTWAPRADLTDTAFDAHVTNTSGDRVPVDLDASDVGGGGGGPMCDDEEAPCQVAIADAGDTLDNQRSELVLGAGLTIFLLAGMFVSSFARRR